MCGFGRTFEVGDLHFLITPAFGDVQGAAERGLVTINLVAVKSSWKQGHGLFWKLRSFLGLKGTWPQSFNSMEAEHSVLEEWLGQSVGQYVEKKMYSWGRVSMLDFRFESYYLFIEYFDVTNRRSD